MGKSTREVDAERCKCGHRPASHSGMKSRGACWQDFCRCSRFTPAPPPATPAPDATEVRGDD